MQRTLTTLLGLAVGVAMLTGPDLTNIGSDAAYDSAFAAKGGNGKGGGAGNGNGKSGATATAQGAGKSASNKSGGKAKSKLDKSLNSRMGALHAANASASAFANSSKNSRVGRIREAILASAATEAAQTAYDDALAGAVEADQGVIDARDAISTLETALLDDTLDADTRATKEAELAAANETLNAAIATATANAIATNEDVKAAQDTLDTYDAAADSAWDAAANKTPVDDDVKQATIDLVGDKVDTSGVVVTPTTP